ncbi:hypothetical protein B0H14DRAFT_3537110 [Mycena olivaceomarginata]|nr:hypothetical protein B0H14DRAFT_3537110 [Mycena olivaceomarginata]
MSRALAQAPKNPKADHNEHLKQYGLHDFEEFSNSDPYKAASYDCLHFFDGGIWGRHLWVVIKEYLQNNGLASDFNQYMSQFPHWRNLKHIQSPTTIDYSEGQTFLDILKISVMDENEETMARLDMLVDLCRRNQEEDNELHLMQPAMDSTAHWRLGSPDSQVLSHCLDVSRDLLFHDFNFRLREYLANHHGSHLVSPQDDIKIEPCKVLYIEYQSMVDW